MEIASNTTALEMPEIRSEHNLFLFIPTPRKTFEQKTKEIFRTEYIMNKKDVRAEMEKSIGRLSSDTFVQKRTNFKNRYQIRALNEGT